MFKMPLSCLEKKVVKTVSIKGINSTLTVTKSKYQTKIFSKSNILAEAYLGLCQTTMIKLF